ncbi:MAG: pyridoxal phosphate-dependent aminotransferase [Acidobacteriaceae bacterium]
MPISFAQRTAWDLSSSETARALEEVRASGQAICNLTASNPTIAGFEYNEAAIIAALSVPAVFDYDPDPRGILQAREAVCAYYADHSASLLPNQLILTTSTSEAYSYLFRLLCNPQDEVLIAQPSYPLFDFLAQICDVRLSPYPLFYDQGWHIDFAALRQRITPRTRAIAMVHPNNPTGHFTSAAERTQLEELCGEHGLALIVDEVFLDYPLNDETPRSFAAGDHPALTFVLSGLSKICGLPQMKAAWIAAFGPERELATALDRLEVIADTYLSMNAPIQHAMGPWLAARGHIQGQIRFRCRANLETLDMLLARQNLVTRLRAEAGWYAILRVPALMDDEELAALLIREHEVAVHPGRFFGFPESGWLVISLLSPRRCFSRGMEAIIRYFNRLDR